MLPWIRYFIDERNRMGETVKKIVKRKRPGRRPGRRIPLTHNEAYCEFAKAILWAIVGLVVSHFLKDKFHP